MNGELLTTLVILIAAVGLLISDRLRPDLVALLVVVSLAVSGVLTAQEAFSGFSRSAVITLMAIFILAEALRCTGVTDQVGDLLLRIAGTGERRMVLIVMVAGAFLSLFMNNIAAASVLLPAVSSAARKRGISPTRVLIPLSFSTLIGGMATLLTTANIVVSSLLEQEGLAGYGLLDFAPVGLPLVAAGILYMVLWGRRRLPSQPPEGWLSASDASGEGLADIYHLGERLFRARVPADSPLLGKPLVKSGLREEHDLNVVALERKGEIMLSPAPDAVLNEGDIVLVEGKPEAFYQQRTSRCLDVLSLSNEIHWDLESPSMVMIEVVLAPRSGLIDQTLREAHFRDKYGMNVLAIWRAGRPIRTGLTDQRLQFGDALLLLGPREKIPLLRSEPDLIVLRREIEDATRVPGKGRLALGIMALALVGVILQPQAVGQILLGAALAMVLLRVLAMDRVYQAIEWKSVFLIAGMLPLGIAMTKTGAAGMIASGLEGLLGAAGPLALLAGIFVVGAILAQVLNSVAVASIMAPIAVQLAQQMGADPRAMAMVVVLAASMTFITPLGHPVNILVMGPGGYRFRDFLRVGLPLTLLLAVVVLLLLPLFWPLMPG